MKTLKNYRSWLTVLSAALLAGVLMILFVVLYGESVRETRDLLLDTAHTRLTASYQKVERELSAINGVCEYLLTSEAVAEQVKVCATPDVSMVLLYRTLDELKELLNQQIYLCDTVRGVIIETPERLIRVEKSYAPFLPVEVTTPGEICLLRDSDGKMRFTFSPAACPDCFIHVLLNDTALSVLMNKCENTLIVDELGVLHRPNAGDAAEVSASVVQDFLTARADSTFLRGYCLVRIPLFQSEWTLVYAEKDGEYTSNRSSLLLMTGLIFAVSVVVSTIIAQIMSKRTLRWLYRFMKRVKSYSPGESTPVNDRIISLRESTFLCIVLSVSFCMIGFCLLFGVTNAIWQREYRAQAKSSMGTAVSSSFENMFGSLRNSAFRISLDKRVQRFVNGEAGLEELGTALRENANPYFSAGTILLMDEEGTVLFSSDTLSAVEIRPEMWERYNEWRTVRGSFGRTMVSFTARAKSTNAFFYVCTLYDASIFGQQLSLYQKVDSSIELVDENGYALLSDSQMNDAGKRALSSIAKTPWNISVSYEPVRIFDAVFQVFYEKAGLVITLLLVAILVSSFMSSMLQFPLVKLSGKVRAIVRGDPTQLRSLNEVSNMPIDELAELEESFNELAEHMEELLDELVTSRNHVLITECARKNAEIVALQSQITPHFLSNTIMLISERIKAGRSVEAVDMLYAMNQLFRYGISRQELVITAGEEWEYAHAYAEIMSARKDGLEIVWEADINAMKRNVIRLVLQPILENAIYHGRRKADQPIVVRVSLTADEDNTYFVVADNGMGIEPETLQQIRMRLSNMRHSTHIGLSNVHARIRLYCGEAYGVQVECPPEGGTRVTLRLPAHLQEDNGDVST